MGLEHPGFEAGISRSGDVSRLAKIIRPTIGVFTGIGTAHQENLRSMEDKLREKLLLFADCKMLIYNADNDLVEESYPKCGPRRPMFRME